MSCSPQIKDWIASTWAEAIRERPSENVWQWAEKNISFDGREGNITGPYRADLTPYTKLFQEAVTSHFASIPDEDWWLRDLLERGHRVDEAFTIKSSQSGYTQAALNALLYLTLFAPGRILYTLESRDKAKQVVPLRVIPQLMRLCNQVLTPDQDDVGMTFIKLAHMVIEFAGSYSSGVFSEKSLRYGFLDDVVYMVSEGGIAGMLNGTHIIDHMRSRFTTADDSFLGVFSKPDLDDDEFVKNHKGGSQHRFWCRCPLCNARQILRPENLRYDQPGCRDLAGRYDLEAVEALTDYKCAQCEKPIEERWKYQMNLDGIWIPKPKTEREKDKDPALVPRRMSMQINDLNSPFPKVRWGQLARLKIEAESNPAKLKYVVTNHWARPWREAGVNLKADTIRLCCAGALDPKTGKPIDAMPAYRRGECPFLPAIVTATADRQGDKFKWIVCGWKLDGTCALIEYGACLSKADLVALLEDPRAHHGGPLASLLAPDAPLACEVGLIDSGHETFDTYQFCIDTGHRWYPCKGVGGIEGGRLIEGKPEVYEGQAMLRYNFNDFQIKVHLYKHKIEKRTAPRLYLPEDVGDDFLIELTSESLRAEPNSHGYKVMKWQHDSSIGPNDFGDALKEQYVLWQLVGPPLQLAQQQQQAA